MKISYVATLKEQSRILRNLSKRVNFWIVLLLDILLIICAHILAYAFRYDFQIVKEVERITAMLPFLVAVKIPVFYIFGLYRGMWRYTSIADLINIAKAVVVSSGFIIMSVLYLNRFEGYSRTVFFVDGVLCFLFVCICRGTIRYLLQNSVLFPWFQHNSGPGLVTKRLLLIGAGSAAEKVIREIHENQRVPYKVVGLVDDNLNKHGLKIHGIPVVGNTMTLKESAIRTGAEELLIAIASATAEEMKRLVEACRSVKIPFKVLPSLGEIIKGRLSVSSIREVDYRDLLGRPVVYLNQNEICGYLTGQIVLVTGAGGSIGSELCRQIVRFKPQRIILLDSGEENLYKIQMELEHEVNFHSYVSVLGNCGNRELLEAIYGQYGPAVVFHAAAYKHVPLVETNPWEGIFNNVIALKTLMEVAIKHKTERFVLVSTDKAVRPTSIMGASKRLTELIMHAYCQEQVEKCQNANTFRTGDSCHAMACMAVRFGNVLGSSGSVIPLFKRQIEMGGPVTVTHPEVTRYFMSIEEASQLILQAGAMGGKGEIFLLKMGEPIKIADMARDLICLMGSQPETDIPIVFTGLRPGEKLYEELITVGEGIVPTQHEKIMMLHGSGVAKKELDTILNQLEGKASLFDIQGIKDLVQKVIPEYVPDIHNQAVIGTSLEQDIEIKN